MSLFLVLTLGMAFRTAHAVTWFPFGPDGGDARAFAADPKNHLHIYLGTANGWVYQTQDGGKSWSRLASVAKRDDLVIDNLLIDPVNPQHMVIGAWKLADLHHPDGGIYISNDAGQTWTAEADMRGRAVLALAVAPSDAKTMVAGSMDGVFRSTDSGTHWELISPKGSTELHEVESVAVDPKDPKIIYAGTWHLPWKTTDGGANWQTFKKGIAEDSDVFSIIVDPKQPNSIYLSACSGIYMSNDGAESFSRAQGIPHSAIRTRVLMQDPNHPNTVFGGTTGGLYRTEDGGHQWTQTTGSDVIVNDVYVDPTDSKRVLLATDRGGVLASDDGGTSFHQSNAGFSTRQVVAYVADAQHPATVYVGVVNDKEWGGVFVSQNGGLKWTQMSGGLDGRDVFSLGQAADGTILAGTSHGIYRWSGAVWERANAEVVLAPVPASGKVKVVPSRAGAKAHAVASKPRPVVVKGKPFDGVVYGFTRVGEGMVAATSQGMLTGSANGKSWTSAASATRDEYHYVAAAKDTVAAASLNALEFSSDSGSTWRTLQLPPQFTQVTALAVDGQGGIWLGGRDGVFYSADAGANWKMMKDLYLRNPDCIFFDEAKNRMLVTSSGPGTTAFAVQLPTMQVTWWDTGWNLRFVRPIGDHLLAGTLFDGIVVQPRMVASPDAKTSAALR
ncbi:MAG: exo-alpha-sialidase [Acidobacteriaceae bacterium]